MSAPWEDFATPATAPVESGPWDDFSEPWKDFEESPTPLSQDESDDLFARFGLQESIAPAIQSPGRDIRQVPGFNPEMVGVAGGNIPQPYGEAADILGDPLRLAMMPFEMSGRVLNAAASDVGATLGTSAAGRPDLAGEQGGNLYELLNRDEPLYSSAPLPQQRVLADISQDNPAIATAGKVAAGLVQSAPMLALMPQGALGKLVAAGFTADMVAHAGDAATRLGTEMGKPEDERDADALTTALSDIIQSAAFAPLAGAHAGGKVIGERVAPKREAIRELANALKSEPRMPVAELPTREPTAPTDAEFIAGDRPQPVATELPVKPKETVAVEPEKRTAPLPPEKVADSDLRVSVQSPMKMGAKEVPGYVQVDSMVGGQNQWSSNPAALKKQGYDIPTEAELQKLPQGQYTLTEAKAKLAEGRPIPEQPSSVDAINRLQPAVLIDGKPALGKSHIEAALEVGTPEAIEAASKSENQGFVFDGEFISREQAAQMIGEKGKLTSERLTELREKLKQPPVDVTPVKPAETPTAPTPTSTAVKGEGVISRQDIADFKTHLNNLDPERKWSGDKSKGQGQRTRPYGDYLYAQDRPKFMADLAQWKQEIQSTTPAPAAEVKINGKFQLPSQGPQTFSVLERLEQTAVEKTNGEQLVRVKNDRTGSEEVVLETELKSVKPGVPGARPKRRTVEDLNAALRKSGMDPSVFLDAKSKANALERAIAKIEEAQAKLRGSRATLSMGVPKAILDVALETVRLSLKAGNSMAKAMAAAVAHIRKEMGEGKFNELEVRNYIADRMLEKPTGTALTDKVEMRTLSERATTSEKIPEPVQEQIKTSPESYYQVQSLKGVQQSSKAKSDAELGATSKNSDAYTSDKLELMTRLMDAGKHEEGFRVWQDLAADLTRMGQVINQAKLFQALRPEHVVTVVNKDLAKAGKDPLTPIQAGRVEAAAQGRITKQAELERATDEWVKNPTDANASKAETALTESNKAAVDEQSLVNQFKPRTTSSVLKSVLQGNLLTPISQVANLIGNVSFIPFRAGTRATATAIDMLDAAIRNRPRQVSASAVGGTKGAVAGLIQGAKQIPSILIRGTGETIKGEPRAGLHPMRAWVKQFAKNPDVPTVGGKIPFSERINLAIEGTFGVPAEIMLRGLGSGDAPFRGAARGRLISEAARLRKLKPSDQKMAQRFPELFFDKATLERIDSEGRAAIFQRHSSTIDRIMELARSRGDLMDFAIATVAPYKLTPWNIVGEILSYNPLIATARAGIEARRGNARAAEMNAGKALVGGMTIYAGYWLYENGLLSPSLDSRDEQQKARMLAGEVMPPNHINVSGLKRKLAGGDPEFKAGDETVDIFRGGGLAGSLFYMVANIGRDAETSPPGDEMLLSVLKNSTLEQARFGVNQSFLKGVTGLLDAVRYGETDNYIQSYAGTILSIPLPNTLSALSRAQRQYKVDASDPKFKKQLENIVRTRLGFAGLDDYLPLKRGLWGEPLLETPTNANALVYHFFDISKNKQVTSDPVPLELYRLWRKTASSSVIPTPPEKTITADRETRVLTPAQHSRYAELVGSARRDIVGRVVANPEWHQIPDEGKMNILEKVYRAGLERGKEEFMIEAWDKLEAKPAKAGFK